MRIVAIFFLLGLLAVAVKAQPLPTIRFHGKPTFTKGISIEFFALFYKDLTGDTLQTLTAIAKQPFLKPALVPQIRSHTSQQMSQTRQLVWLQFRVANSHSTDTLRLYYAGGIHAVYTLYQKHKDYFQRLGNNGLCVPNAHMVHGYGGNPS